MFRGAVLASLLVICAAQSDKLDNLRSLEAAKQPLDELPPSDVKKDVHTQTPQDELAMDPESLFIGRDVESV